MNIPSWNPSSGACVLILYVAFIWVIRHQQKHKQSPHSCLPFLVIDCEASQYCWHPNQQAVFFLFITAWKKVIYLFIYLFIYYLFFHLFIRFFHISIFLYFYNFFIYSFICFILVYLSTHSFLHQCF